MEFVNYLSLVVGVCVGVAFGLLRKLKNGLDLVRQNVRKF